MILTTNTPYPSRKIRRIRACTHQRPQRKEDQCAVSKEDQYAVLDIWHVNILEDIKRGPYSKKPQYAVSNALDTPYIPELKRNVISMGTLKKDGYTIKLQSGKVKLINGELNASVEEKDSLAQVWNKRLGHISEAGLHVLEKKGLFGKKSLGGYGMVKKLRTDNGLEFCNWEFEQLCIESGIARHLTVHGTPPSRYILYMLDDQLPKIVTSRNAVLNESVMYKDTLKDSGVGVDKSIEELHVEVELQRLNNYTPEEDQTDQKDGDDEDAWDQETDQTPNLTDYQLTRDKKRRTRTKPLRFRDESDMAAYTFVAVEEKDTHEPLTYQEAVACEDSSKWKAAMK
ncbi:retrotransposon protein, putative, ty1-copia subclass [Tanacetum coccineum]